MSSSFDVLPGALDARRRPRGMWSHDGLDEVEAVMLRLASGERLDRLGVIVREHLATGGKRLRARLALAAAEVLGARREDAVAWAAACELLHNATLVHDDLQDGDAVRRGRSAVWARHGVAQAVNAGDLLLMLPYVAIEHVPVPDGTRWLLSRALARYAEQVARGQSAEMELLAMHRLDWDSYATSVLGKTAALFALPIYGAALIAGRSHEEAEAIAQELLPIGLLFQVQDDVVDLYGDKGRDVVGSDLYEGKVSALVVEHCRLHPRDRDALLELLQTPRDETQADAVDAVITRFRDGGALAAVWRRMGDIEVAVNESEVLACEPRLHACACELVAMALAPIIHTDPHHGLPVCR